MPLILQQPGLPGVRVPEARPDADHRQQHRGRSAKPLHPGVLLLQPHQGGCRSSWVGGAQRTPTLTAPCCVPQREVLLKVLMVLALLAVAYGYFTCYFTDEDTRRSRVGLFCSSFTIVMYASPLADLVRKAGWDRGRCRGDCVAPGQPLAPRRPR